MNGDDVNMYPQQSFQHTMKEIAVNREDPCELVRELISNAYDADATKILVFPYFEKSGLVFWDNGLGLSQAKKDEVNGIVPYAAFFSIGKTTKPRGTKIGYKCQGSKLCFASARVTVLTRCAGEPNWRWKTIDNPRQTLDTDYPLKPETTDAPWQFLRDKIFRDPDERTRIITTTLDEDFFRKEFLKGTLIVVEQFDVEDYDKYFSVDAEQTSYVYNYIRLLTAHGDVRRIDFANNGFTEMDRNTVLSHGVTAPAELRLLMQEDGALKLVSVPPYWPYLPVQDGAPEATPPALVNRLRDGRFHARYATSFKHVGQSYTLILAVDGRRRALDEYRQLGRQRNRGCGIPLSSQRGTFLASHGVKICAYNELFGEPSLKEFEVLRYLTEHHVFLINGNFELTTSRNAPSPESRRVLKDAGFVEKIREFLESTRNKHPKRQVFKELVEVLRREQTLQREEQYQKMMADVKKDLPTRNQFSIEGLDALKGKWFYEPARGEENFVGALYTLFSHVVPDGHTLRNYWIRPLTFHSFGIDAVACTDEARVVETAQYLEYKHTFSTDMEFNHPFSITKTIVCWDFVAPKKGDGIADSYNYVAQVGDMIEHNGQQLGFYLEDIRLRSGLNAIGGRIAVLSLKRLIRNTFQLKERAAPPAKV